MKLTEKQVVQSINSFNNLHVKNMYWLLFSPSPLDENSFLDYPLFPDDWLCEIEKDAHEFFKEIDTFPEGLESFIEQSNSYRMGIYAELLMHYFLAHFDDTELILANYQLIKDKLTIGEIDFIFSWKGKVIHLEMAVKFYLRHKHSNEFQDWIGPSGNDNLYKKLKKVKNHQLKLTLNEQFIKEQKLEAQPYFLMKGMFFNRSIDSPKWMNQKVQRRGFMHLKEFMDSDFSNDALLLRRPNWMAGLYQENKEMVELNFKERDLFELIEKYNSLHIWIKSDQSTLMVVKDEWPFKTNI
jgi:hypothetical protein